MDCVYNSFPSIKHTTPSGVDSSRKETSSDPLSPHPLVITLITGVCLSIPFHDIASVYYFTILYYRTTCNWGVSTKFCHPLLGGRSFLSPLVPQLFLLSFTESARNIFRLQKDVYEIFFSNNLLLTCIGSRMKNGTRVSTQQSKPSNSLYSLFHSLFSDTGVIFSTNDYPSYLPSLWCKKSEDLIPPAKCWRMRPAYPVCRGA